MNFINPYVTIYSDNKTLEQIPFHKEIIWTFLKNLDNRLKLFQHRLNIYIDDAEPSGKISRFGSIFEYRIKLIRSFGEISELEKRKDLLNLIFEAFNAVGKEYKWDTEIIEESYLKSKGQLDNFEYLTEKKLNRSNEFTGQLKLKLDGRKLIFRAEIHHIENSSNESYELFSTDEDNFSWNRMFKEFGWYDNHKFGLKFLSGDLWIVIDAHDGKVEEIKESKKFDSKKIDKYLEDLKRFLVLSE